MRGVQALALALLQAATAIATDANYVPMHKRHTFDARMDDFSYLGMLSRRDVCSDAFGEDSERATCVPSMTLCCGSPPLPRTSQRRAHRLDHQASEGANHFLLVNNISIKDGVA